MDGLDSIHNDVDSVRLADFPDYTNIGDSAIALGSFAFWEKRDVRLLGVHSLFSTPRNFYTDHASTVALQGGGTFGGLYPPMDRYRLHMVRELNPETMLVQMPQSVLFPTPADLRANKEAFAARSNVRVAARDHASHARLTDADIPSSLVPDAAHALGPLKGPAPTRSHVILARTDPEAARGTGAETMEQAFDWPRATLAGRVLHRIKYQRPWPDTAQRLADRPSEFWINRAQYRLDTGIPLLSAGRTVITDRLHAMILGLHLGRRVIAVDNANNKLTNYASTWLTASDLPLEFRTTFGDAVRAASTTQL